MKLTSVTIESDDARVLALLDKPTLKPETTHAFMAREAVAIWRHAKRWRWAYCLASLWDIAHWFANKFAWRVERSRGIRTDTARGLLGSVFQVDHSRWWWKANNWCFKMAWNTALWDIRRDERKYLRQIRKRAKPKPPAWPR